jgi:hypothetical protein
MFCTRAVSMCNNAVGFMYYMLQPLVEVFHILANPLSGQIHALLHFAILVMSLLTFKQHRLQSTQKIWTLPFAKQHALLLLDANTMGCLQVLIRLQLFLECKESSVLKVCL